MIEMTTRPHPRPRRPGTRLALPMLVVLVLAGCVPPPVGRPTPSPATAIPTAPASGTPGPSPTGPSPSPSFVRPTPTPLPTFMTYTVQRGDTLSSIARTFATTPFSLAYWNRDAYPSLDPESEGYDPNRIEIGWSFLIIPGVEVDESDLPVPSARPTASPTSTPPATAAPSSTAASRKVSHGDRGSTMVALTFDMGGRLDPALDIMGWLIANEVHASVFPTGKTGTTTTVGRQALEQVVAHPELFELGNHSWSHPDFRDLTDAQIRDELVRTEDALVSTLGASSRPWFRPPFGGVNDQVLKVVGSVGFGYTVMWDVDTIDWRPESDGGPTAQQMVDKVVGNAKGGTIVLMHLGGFNTFEALPAMVAGLRARGLEPVTLAEMFGE